MSALSSKVCIQPAALQTALSALKHHDPHQAPGSGKEAKKGGEAKAAGGGNAYEERQAALILRLFKDQFGNPTVSRRGKGVRFWVRFWVQRTVLGFRVGGQTQGVTV
jgi:hypothetical protein